jgi:hypothetical protein
MRRVLLTALALAFVATASPAAAVIPPERTVHDRVEPGKAYDIVSVTLRAAPAEGERATLRIDYDRPVGTGDGITVWIDTDGDRLPDLYIGGVSFSEYAVFKARGWDGHGRDITDLNCVRLRMIAKRTVIKFDPSCLAPSETFSASVRSYVQGEPERTADVVPGVERLTKRVRSVVAD